MLINVKRLHNYVNIDATEIQVTGNNFVACPKPGPGFPTMYDVVFILLFHGLRWESDCCLTPTQQFVIYFMAVWDVHLVDIGVTVLLLFIIVI